MKDNFSHNSNAYSKFRPVYPDDLFEYLKTEIKNFNSAWDCGTGTGQVALPLSESFNSVYATDISRSQLANAPEKENIHYSIQPAEKTDFDRGMFDLITVGQAIHWFDFDKFYAEAYRTMHREGLISIIGYGLLQTNKDAQKIILDFYQNMIGPYWDPERRYIDEKYATIPFPFKEIKAPQFETKVKWSFDHLTGYLETWSAVKHFKEKRGYDPVAEISPQLFEAFGAEGKIVFPILLRMGRLQFNPTKKLIP